MTHIKTIAVPALFVALFIMGCTAYPGPTTQEISEVRGHVETGTVPSFVPNDARSRSLWKATAQVYTLRQFRPVFFSNGRVEANVNSAVQTLANATAEGLHPEDFGLSELQNRRRSLENADAAARNEFELRLTYGLARYISQLCFGRVTPKQINPDWTDSPKICDIPNLLNAALEQDTIAQLATELSPDVSEYQGLKIALQRYRDLAAEGGWEPLPVAESKKKRGSSTPTPTRSALLAANLALMGDLKTSSNVQPVPDASLNEALRSFQTRHGLEATGKLDAKTVAAMNVPLEDRIAQIEINMDRLRWIADRFEARHIRVNIPGFHLSVHDGDQIPLEMRVIVGSPKDRTPLLDGQIEYLVFSPYWNIPLSIARKELVPKIRKDPSYLAREEMEVVRVTGNSVQRVDPAKIDWDAVSKGSGYQLRQRPGASNALGLVKFIFPNPYNVYLHDTPTDNLFDRLTRTLSHGCIRAEKPVELAAYLLQDQPEWTPQRIETAMHAEKEKHVRLETPIPIHLLYWTAWADPDGTAHFHNDVYGYDQKQRELSSPTVRAGLPAANPSDIDVHEVGAG